MVDLCSLAIFPKFQALPTCNLVQTPVATDSEFERPPPLSPIGEVAGEDKESKGKCKPEKVWQNGGCMRAKIQSKKSTNSLVKFFIFRLSFSAIRAYNRNVTLRKCQTYDRTAPAGGQSPAE